MVNLPIHISRHTIIAKLTDKSFVEIFGDDITNI